MKLKARKPGLLLLVVLLTSSLGRSGPQSRAQIFIRYEQSQAHNRLGESLLGLRHPIKNEDKTSPAIRLCSKRPLPIAMATATADPFLIADRLAAYGYRADRIMFLRSEDCLAQNRSKSVTEVWTIPENASLPSNIDAFRSNEVKIVPLGKERGRLGMRDYKRALTKLIQRLRANPSSTGIIVGYILRKPSPVLQRRMREVRRTLQQSGIASDRYLVHLMGWPDEYSEHPPDPEARYPNVSVIEIIQDSSIPSTISAMARVSR